MTENVSGGVPEQGLREAASLTKLLLDTAWEHTAAGPCWCDRDGPLHSERCQRIQAAFVESGQALERPRPALPPETFADNRGLIGALQDIAYQARYDRTHATLGGPTDPFEYYERVSRTALAAASSGAALPPQTGNPPPDLAPIVRDLMSALWTQTRLVCTEEDHPRSMRCQSCASRESINRAEAALRGNL